MLSMVLQTMLPAFSPSPYNMSAFVCTTYVQSSSKTFWSFLHSVSMRSQKSSEESTKIFVARFSASLLEKKFTEALSKIFPDSVPLRSFVPMVFFPATAVPTTAPKAWSRFLSCSVKTNWLASRPMSTMVSPKSAGTKIRKASPWRARMDSRTPSNGRPLRTSPITETMFAHGGSSSSRAPSLRSSDPFASAKAKASSPAAKAATATPPPGTLSSAEASAVSSALASTSSSAPSRAPRATEPLAVLRTRGADGQRREPTKPGHARSERLSSKAKLRSNDWERWCQR
mmetsp:Transcript_25638/g.51712  ORF Transcript_25638/g.51712 Transcript_25638/m.51712 type:complete len:286 (+) Transcript_25638:1070-1927(+)